MDILKFLDSLDYSFKQLAIALALVFPLAYFDCWKISESFYGIEIIKQIILSLGIDVMSIVLGFFLLGVGRIIALPIDRFPSLPKDHTFNFSNSPMWIIFLFIVPSICVAFSWISSILWFCLVYIFAWTGFIVFCIGLRYSTKGICIDAEGNITNNKNTTTNNNNE